ncbi:multicopper oxidase domain-containing protein [Streptomyces sp. NPDC048623]|uniref:multicopper oxidase family protein n=1 Tax=Streptomyces sp. NPDC048623 TaxID=3155761 RepID=UPI0034162548
MTADSKADGTARGTARSALGRRRFLGIAAGTGIAATTFGAAAYASLAGESTGRVLTSRCKPVPRFAVPLPVPPVARAARRENGADVFEVEQREARIEIVPGLKTTVWGYDGIFPGPTFTGRSGEKMVVRVLNTLPVPTSTHLHGGVTPPDSDGYPTDLVVPGALCGDKLRTAMSGHAMSGHAMSGKDMDTTRAPWHFSPGSKAYEYPLDQRAATLWYHDHRMDFSAPQVWRGLAGFFLIHDDEEDRLPLPRGEKDIPLLLCDRAFEEDGEFRYPAKEPGCTGEPGVLDAYMDGVLGDVQLVNGAPWPVRDVTATRHRLRLLNGSNARRYRLALEPGPRQGVAFTQIGSDGGLLGRPQGHQEIPLAPGERHDVIVDFAGYPPGTEVTLVNTLGEGRMREVMRFRVTRHERDDTRVPTRLSAVETLRETDAVQVRRFDFRRTAAEDEHAMWTVNGRPFSTTDVLARPRLGTVERWRFTSDFHHPVHLHLAQFEVLSRDGKPPRATDVGWKDTVDVRPYEVVEVLARFAGHRGRYMVHCHNLEHEDMAMMANFEVV